MIFSLAAWGTSRFYACTILLGAAQVQGVVAGIRRVFVVSSHAWQRDIDLCGIEASDEWKRCHEYEDDHVWDVAVGQDGTVYLSGYIKGFGSWDAFVSKYTWSGQFHWTQLHGTNLIDDATSVTSTCDGLVLVAGFTEGALGGETNQGMQDAFVAQYDANGTHLWTRLLGTGFREEAVSVAAGADGSVIVGGWSEGGLGNLSTDGIGSTGKDIFVAKLTKLGHSLWIQALATQENDEARRVAVQDDGSVIVAGYTFGMLHNSSTSAASGVDDIGDIFVAKLSPQGGILWVRQHLRIGAGTVGASLTGLACGGDGSIFVGGFTMVEDFLGQNNAGGIDSFVAKYSSGGDLLWTNLLGSSVDDKAWSIVSTVDGGVLLAGASQGSLGGQHNHGGWDAFVAQYSPSGLLLWVDLVGTNEDDEAKAIALPGAEKKAVMIAGYTYGHLDTNLGGDFGNHILNWSQPIAEDTTALEKMAQSLAASTAARGTLLQVHTAAVLALVLFVSLRARWAWW